MKILIPTETEQEFDIANCRSNIKTTQLTKFLYDYKPKSHKSERRKWIFTNCKPVVRPDAPISKKTSKLADILATCSTNDQLLSRCLCWPSFMMSYNTCCSTVLNSTHCKTFARTAFLPNPAKQSSGNVSRKSTTTDNSNCYEGQNKWIRNTRH